MLGPDKSISPPNGDPSAPPFTMMHPAFQNPDAKNQRAIMDENSGGEKTYTELKMYKEDNRHYQPDASMQCGNSLGNHHLDGRDSAHNLNGNSESDGSDSEEIDLTSGACIDFSANSNMKNNNNIQ